MDYTDSDKGRCKSCGFLAKHPQGGGSIPAPRFYEIEPHERISSSHVQLFSHRPDMAYHGHMPTELVCFVGQVDLMAHIRDIPVDNADDQAKRCRVALKVIEKPRDCPAWYPYTAGFNPKEHYEDLKMQRLEDDRRAFEFRLAEMNETALARSADIARQSHQTVADLKALAEQSDRFSRRVTLWIVLLAIVQTVGMIVAIPSVHWVQRFWHYLFG